MAGKRRRISDRTFLAATLLDRGEIPYKHAKLMTEDQLISLYHADHNILHETGHPDRDKYWNLKPRLIKEHREKTKRDAKIIARSRRIRRKLAEHERKRLAKIYEDYRPYDYTGRIADALVTGFREGTKKAYDRIDAPLDTYSERYKDIDWKAKPKRKIRGRGFDKTKRRRMDGTVVKT
jgi:hypothetical protein